MKVSLDKDRYTILSKYLEAVAKYCSDCEINNGILRVRSDNKAVMYDINLKDVYQENLSISSVSNFVDILKIFSPDEDNNLTLETTESDIILQDNYTRISFQKPIQDVLINKFVTEESLTQIGFFDREEIFSTELPEQVFERIKAVSKNFSVSVVRLTVSNGKVNMNMKSESKTKTANFFIPTTNITLPDGNYLLPFALIDFPFTFPISLNIYKLPNGVLLSSIESDTEKIFSGVVEQQN